MMPLKATSRHLFFVYDQIQKRIKHAAS